MSKRETNAERLARVREHGGATADEAALFDALSYLEGDVEEDRLEAARTIIDILYSWRTCGNCKHLSEHEGIAPAGSSQGPIINHCGCDPSDEVVNPMYMESVAPDEDGCRRFWEERTE